MDRTSIYYYYYYYYYTRLTAFVRDYPGESIPER